MSKDEYSLGNIKLQVGTLETPLRITLQPMTLSATATVGLRPDQLRQLGEEAAREAGLPFDALSVSLERDASDEPAYFFTYSIPRVNNATGRTRGRLSRELRDRLLAMGASLYPYIRITSH